MILEVVVAVLLAAVIFLLVLGADVSRRVWALEEKERALREWIDETDEWCNEATVDIDDHTMRLIRLESPTEVLVSNPRGNGKSTAAAKRAEKERLMRENKENANG